MKEGTNDITLKDGFSESAWRSLAVKSIRLGWPAGLIEAEKRLGKSYMKQALLCGAFEDIFPAITELAAVREEIQALNYPALCARETHHARGHTARFCELKDEACGLAKNRPEAIMLRARQSYSLALSPRACNVFWTWHLMQPSDAGKTRDLDDTPWTGMPEAMLDSHTYEGKVARVDATVLSGHYAQHARLSKLVTDGGWQSVRSVVHSKVRRVAVKPSWKQDMFL